MKSRWSSLRANRPYQQAGMSVEVYYRQFCDWKDEINREGYQCSEASIIDDFVNRMTWDLLVRMYGYLSPPFSLSEAFKRAQFEESIISLEDLTMQIRADKVFEELSHPISIDTAENQGSEDDNFKLQLKTNEQQWKILNSWSEPENEGKNAEDVSTTVLHPCQIAISQVDEMEKFHSSKIGVLGSGHHMFDEMPELISAVRNKGTDVREEEVPIVRLPRDLCYGSGVTKVSSFNISSKSMLEEVFMFVDIKNRELDIDFGDDKILICIFDPGGSSLFYDDGDFFELNKEQGDCCFTTIVDDACARSDEYYNDASNGESVCPFSMVVPILQLVVSIQVGIIVKVYDVPSHTGVLPYRELYRVFLEWNGEEILIPTIEKTFIIIKASSELNGEGSSTPKFLIDQNFWWISLIVYFNTVRERGSQLGAYIRVAIKLISQEVKSLFSKAVILKEIGESYTRVVIASLNPLELWLGTCELDGSLLDQSFTQPPRLFWKWIVWRVVSLCLFSWNLLLASSYEMLGVNRVNSVATGTTLITVDLSLESSISFCWDIKKATVVERPPQNCKWIDNNILAIEFNTTGRQLLWVGYVAALNGDEDDVYFVDKSTEVVISLSRFGDNHERFFINRSWFVYNGNVAGSPGVDMSHQRLVKETYNFIQQMPLGLDVCQRKVLRLASKIEFMEVTNKIYNLKNKDVLCISLIYDLLWPDCDSFNGWGWFAMVWGVSITLKGVTGFWFSPTHLRDVTFTSSIIFFGLEVACKENEKGYTRVSNKRYNDFKTRKKLMRTKAQPGMLEGSFKHHNSLNLKHMKELLGDLKLRNHPGVFFMIQAVGNACGTIWASSNVTLLGERTEEMETGREYGRKPRQIRPLTCSHSIFSRAHGSVSWSQGDTKVLAAVYGPKVRIRKNENPEKAYIEVVWKLKSWQIGKAEGEYEMILKKNLQSICLLKVHSNPTTSILIQYVSDDCVFLPYAINTFCDALVDAGVPLKNLDADVCCSLANSGHILLLSHLLSKPINQTYFWKYFITGHILNVVDVFIGAMTNSYAIDQQVEEAYDNVFGDVAPNITLSVCVEDNDTGMKILVVAIVTGISTSAVKLENFVWDLGLYMLL